MRLEDRLTPRQTSTSRSDQFRPVALASEAFFRLLAQNPSQQSEIMAKGINPNNFSYTQLKQLIENTQLDYLTADGTNNYLDSSNSTIGLDYVNKAMNKGRGYENNAFPQDQQARELQKIEELLVGAYVSGILDYDLIGREFQGLDRVRARNGLKEFLKQKLGLTTRESGKESSKESSSADYQAVLRIVENSTNYKLLETIGVQTPTTETYRDLKPSIVLEKALEGPINPKYVIAAEPVGGPTTIALAQEKYLRDSGSTQLNNVQRINQYEAMQKNPLYRTLLNQAKELSQNDYHSVQLSIQESNRDLNNVVGLKSLYGDSSSTSNLALVNGAGDVEQARSYQPPVDLLSLNPTKLSVDKPEEFRLKESFDRVA